VRRTPLVDMIERVLPSVVNISTLVRGADGSKIVEGSGWVLHESGYVITNYHVLKSRSPTRVTLSDEAPCQYRLLAYLPYEDLALIQINATGPLKPVRLGRSHDLMLGEDVLVIGNPGGLNHTVTPGIISGLGRSGGPTANSTRIQTTAAVNPGNSGGPLFNALGELIGIVQGKMDADNIGFAIQVDRLREVFPQMMSPEQRFGLVLGMEVDTLNTPVTVSKLVADSPAHVAGVHVGDEVLRAGELTIRHGLDFYIALVGHKPGESFPLELRRDEETVSVSVQLGDFAPPEPVTLDGLEQGLEFAVYAGRWNVLPDFDRLEPANSGTCTNFTHYPDGTDPNQDKDHFAVKLTGYVKIPSDGLYFFYTNSDDGSRLHVADQLVVDNDRAHAVRETGGQIRLKAGLYPITATFFERDENQLLEVAWEGPDLDKEKIPSDVLFHKTKMPQTENTDSD
jgi:S1-C subfamily serine protease